jgi:hypothetical protein
MIADLYGILICVVGVLGIAWILWVMRDGDKDRHDEDDARAFFDVHGHWPDETPEQVAAEAERQRTVAAVAVHAPVSQPSPDGFV